MAMKRRSIWDVFTNLPFTNGADAKRENYNIPEKASPNFLSPARCGRFRGLFDNAIMPTDDRFLTFLEKRA